MKSKIRKIYEIILDRLPSTYPRGELIIHPSWKSLIREFKRDRDNPETKKIIPIAFCTIDENHIHLSRHSLKWTDDLIANVLLHEIGHLYAFQKYGLHDERWSDYHVAEKYANDFASRWVRVLKKEKII